MNWSKNHLKKFLNILFLFLFLTIDIRGSYLHLSFVGKSARAQSDDSVEASFDNEAPSSIPPFPDFFDPSNPFHLNNQRAWVNGDEIDSLIYNRRANNSLVTGVNDISISISTDVTEGGDTEERIIINIEGFNGKFNGREVPLIRQHILIDYNKFPVEGFIQDKKLAIFWAKNGEMAILDLEYIKKYIGRAHIPLFRGFHKFGDEDPLPENISNSEDTKRFNQGDHNPEKIQIVNLFSSISKEEGFSLEVTPPPKDIENSLTSGSDVSKNYEGKSLFESGSILIQHDSGSKTIISRTRISQFLSLNYSILIQGFLDLDGFNLLSSEGEKSYAKALVESNGYEPVVNILLKTKEFLKSTIDQLPNENRNRYVSDLESWSQNYDEQQSQKNTQISRYGKIRKSIKALFVSNNSAGKSKHKHRSWFTVALWMTMGLWGLTHFNIVDVTSNYDISFSYLMPLAIGTMFLLLLPTLALVTGKVANALLKNVGAGTKGLSFWDFWYPTLQYAQKGYAIIINPLHRYFESFFKFLWRKYYARGESFGEYSNLRKEQWIKHIAKAIATITVVMNNEDRQKLAIKKRLDYKDIRSVMLATLKNPEAIVKASGEILPYPINDENLIAELEKMGVSELESVLKKVTLQSSEVKNALKDKSLIDISSRDNAEEVVLNKGHRKLLDFIEDSIIRKSNSAIVDSVRTVVGKLLSKKFSNVKEPRTNDTNVKLLSDVLYYIVFNEVESHIAKKGSELKYKSPEEVNDFLFQIIQEVNFSFVLKESIALLGRLNINFTERAQDKVISQLENSRGNNTYLKAILKLFLSKEEFKTLRYAPINRKVVDMTRTMINQDYYIGMFIISFLGLRAWPLNVSSDKGYAVLPANSSASSYLGFNIGEHIQEAVQQTLLIFLLLSGTYGLTFGRNKFSLRSPDKQYANPENEVRENTRETYLRSLLFWFNSMLPRFKKKDNEKYPSNIGIVGYRMNLSRFKSIPLYVLFGIGLRHIIGGQDLFQALLSSAYVLFAGFWLFAITVEMTSTEIDNIAARKSGNVAKLEKINQTLNKIRKQQFKTKDDAINAAFDLLTEVLNLYNNNNKINKVLEKFSFDTPDTSNKFLSLFRVIVRLNRITGEINEIVKYDFKEGGIIIEDEVNKIVEKIESIASGKEVNEIVKGNLDISKDEIGEIRDSLIKLASQSQYFNDPGEVEGLVEKIRDLILGPLKLKGLESKDAEALAHNLYNVFQNEKGLQPLTSKEHDDFKRILAIASAITSAWLAVKVFVHSYDESIVTLEHVGMWFIINLGLAYGLYNLYEEPIFTKANPIGKAISRLFGTEALSKLNNLNIGFNKKGKEVKKIKKDKKSVKKVSIECNQVLKNNDNNNK